ncbi:MAG: prepilin peptidase [Candidatus Norongarragalinales archaeon]
MADFLPAAAFVFAFAASASDLGLRRIPDPLNLSFFALAFSASLASGVLPAFALFSVFSFLLSRWAYGLGAWGGGDVKFFVSLSSFLPALGEGLESVFLLFVVSAFLCGLAALSAFSIKLLKNGRVKSLAGPGRVVFAPFLAAAFAIVVFFK